MQALILAGGEGTRLRPLTTKVPKPVVPLANRPFISYMLDWLERPRLRRRRDVVRLPRRGRAQGARVGRSATASRSATWRSPSRSGPPVPVKLAEPMLDERFAVLNGDILTDIDLIVGGALPRGARRARDADPDAGRGPVVLRGDRHRRRRAGRGVHREAAGRGARATSSTPGIYVLEREVVGDDPGRPARSRSSARSSRRSSAPASTGSSASGYWLDIGTPDRYLQATRDILAGRVETDGAARASASGTQVDPAALVCDPVLTGSSCEIAAERARSART